MLADTMPGMSNLNIFFTSIWQELERIPIRFQESSGDLMYYRQELENEEFLPIKVERSDYISFIYKELTNYVKKLVDNVTDDNTQDIKIPKHLTKFVKNQVDKWVISAIDAKYQYKLNHHYLIVKDNKGVSRVTPVDYANTGIVQNNTTWGDGLQQFLQIKEGLKITPETLITNFLSNKAYFERYNSRIYGLTGTLGSDSAKKFLKDIYKIDFVNIPRYKNRPFIEKETIIAESKEEWTKNIIETTLNEVTDKRAVLIICETKKNADKLFNELTTRYRVEGRKGRVIAYTRNDNNENRAVESRLHSGDIVVATNLAGRGTDIKTTKEVEDAGGLHLCVTFLADNLRVEQQAFGRTARQGQKGSAQLIINKDKLGNEYLGADNIKTIREIRNDLEENKLDSFQKNELPQINLKDQLFSRLCNLLTKLRSKVNKDDELEVILHEYKLESIEERWGLFLKHLDFSDINSIESKFEEFIKKIDQEYQSDDVIENPSYYIRYGNALIDHINDWKTKAKKHLATTARVVVSSVIPLVNVKNEYQEHKDLACRKALEAFDQAIKLDPEYSHAAYYKKAYILIEMKANGYKEKAKKNLQEAQKIVVDTIPRLMATQLSFNAHGTSNLDSEFSNQISNKVNILKALSESIHQSIRVIDKSEKLIDVSCHGKNFTALKKEAALEKVKSFYGKNDITVKFHDLKAHSDMGTKYQAKNTIDAALEEYPALRNIDITFNNLGKEQAINLLPSFRRDKTEDSTQDKNIQKEKMLPEEYEALSWMEKRKIDIHKLGQDVKDGVVNKYNTAKEVTNYCYNSAKNWLDEYEAAKKVPVNLSLYNLSQNQAGDLLKSLPSINEVMVTINTENKNGIDKYLSVQDAQKFIGEFTQTLRDSIKKTLEQEDSVNSTQISIDEVIGKQLDGVGINLTFRKLSQKTAKDLIDNSEPNNIDLNFEDLGQKDTKRIIYANEDHIGDSVIIFNSLDRDQARFIIEKADRTEQDVEVQDIKRLEDLFLISDMPKAEIIEARADGIDGIIHLYEQQPIKVASCLTVGALGVGQIILGSILIAVPDVGTALISEGIGDIITSVRGAVSRNFSWDDYFIQKSISIAISLATAGLGRLNSVKNTAQYSTKTKIALGTVDDRIMRNVSKQVMTTINKSAINTGEQIAMKETINISEKIIEKGISGIAQDSWKTAGKLVLTQLAESGAKEALNLGVDQLSEIGIKSFQPQVAEKVELSLKNAFDHLNITKSIAIDKYQENKDNQSRIEDRAYKILNPRNNRLLSSLTSISTGILNKKSSKSSIGSFIEPLKQVAEMSSALSKVITITDNFDHDFTKYLDKLDLIKVEDLIFKGQKFDNTEKRAILKELEKHSIINVKEDFIDIESIKYPDNKEKFFESGLYNEISTSSKPKKFSYPNNIEDIRLNEQTKNNVKNLGNLLHATHTSERNMLHKNVSNMITNQIIGTIQSGLVKPMTSLAISKAVQYASEKIQRHVNNGRTVMEEVDALQKSENLKGKYEGFMRALSEEEKAKYLPLYEQAIEDAKTGKGNMLHLLVLVKELEARGEPIKISLFKDGKYYDTIGNNDSTNCIVIDNSDDHWTVMEEKTREFRNADKTGSGNNDCLFDCLAKYTNGKSADELRNLTVAGLNENQDYLIHFMPAYQSASNNPDLFGGMWSGGCSKCIEYKFSQEELEKYGTYKVIEITFENFEKIVDTAENVSLVVMASGALMIILGSGLSFIVPPAGAALILTGEFVLSTGEVINIGANVGKTIVKGKDLYEHIKEKGLFNLDTGKKVLSISLGWTETIAKKYGVKNEQVLAIISDCADVTDMIVQDEKKEKIEECIKRNLDKHELLNKCPDKTKDKENIGRLNSVMAGTKAFKDLLDSEPLKREIKYIEKMSFQEIVKMNKQELTDSLVNHYGISKEEFDKLDHKTQALIIWERIENKKIPYLVDNIKKAISNKSYENELQNNLKAKLQKSGISQNNITIAENIIKNPNTTHLSCHEEIVDYQKTINYSDPFSCDMSDEIAMGTLVVSQLDKINNSSTITK